ncbi:MAG: hypothetical protein ACOYJJ_02890 [Anaerovoracaceae bacterium]|jgi:hypothetical protein
MLVGIIALAFSVLGIVGYFKSMFYLTYLGAAAAAVDALNGFSNGQHYSAMALVIAAVAGAFIAGGELNGVCLAMCIEEAIVGGLGMIILLTAGSGTSSGKKK